MMAELPTTAMLEHPSVWSLMARLPRQSVEILKLDCEPAKTSRG
jgi:hypothetical protein